MGRTTGRTGPRTLAAIALMVTPLLAGSADAQAPAATPYAITAVDTAHGDREFHLLWPDGAPGALGSEAVDKPKITVYLAPADRATGAAVVVCPGGGYRVVAADHEGKQIAEWLNSLGVSAFVLQYRLGERYRHPAPLQDAQRAIRTVRSRAKEWGVDPRRIGILGFSAGGHLASTAATHFDDGRSRRLRPDRARGLAAGLRRPLLRRHLARGPAGALGLAPPPPGRPARPRARRAPEQREAGHGAHPAHLPLAHRRRLRGARRELAPLLRGPAQGGCAPASSTSSPTASTAWGWRRETRRSPSGRGSAPSGWRAWAC